MKRVITSILSSALLFAWVSPAAAQFGPPPPAPDPKAKPILRTADGHPDFNGVWWFGGDLPVQALNVNIGERPKSAPPLAQFLRGLVQAGVHGEGQSHGG
jgi:hypothetical protein